MLIPKVISLFFVHFLRRKNYRRFRLSDHPSAHVLNNCSETLVKCLEVPMRLLDEFLSTWNIRKKRYKYLEFFGMGGGGIFEPNYLHQAMMYIINYWKMELNDKTVLIMSFKSQKNSCWVKPSKSKKFL